MIIKVYLIKWIFINCVCIKIEDISIEISNIKNIMIVFLWGNILWKLCIWNVMYVVWYCNI